MLYRASGKYKCRMCGQIILDASVQVEEHELPALMLPNPRPPERWEKRLAQQIVHKCLLAFQGCHPRRGIADLLGVSLREDPPSDDGKKP